MKVWKSFSMMFLYPVMLLGSGFLMGAWFVDYYYPGMTSGYENALLQERDGSDGAGALQEAGDNKVQQGTDKDSAASVEASQAAKNSGAEDMTGAQGDSAQTSVIRDRLNADTAYVLEETDLRSDSVVETTWKLPAKYIGMNRAQFLEAMMSYEASPPLEELQRGFVSLEVLSFSPQKVVVQMNYDYPEPLGSFYLTVENNYVVVYQEDRSTVYMDTDILLKELPEDVQQEIIQVMYVPDEESLYNFLENYSS